jgi:DNA repair photolyase
MTVTSYDNELTKLVEPFVPRSRIVHSQILQRERILTLKRLSEIGVDTYLHITPYFPHVTDKDLIKELRELADEEIILLNLLSDRWTPWSG